ncbi:MAG: M1 family metallopeptidase [Terriglobia bacterium]
MRRTERSRLNQFHSIVLADILAAALAASCLFVFSSEARGMTAAQSTGAASSAATSAATSLAAAPTAQLLKIYAQLRSLQGSNQAAVLENVAWKRDAATFTFKDGTLTFAAPVAGRVVAAVFTGDATFELDPPTPAERRQIARFTGKPNLIDGFKRAVFFFTDDSWGQLQKLITIKPRGDADAAGKALDAAENRYQQNNNNWWENERKGNFTMQNLAARMMADLTDPSSKGLFLADIHAEQHGNLFYEISWNRKTTLFPEISNGDEVMLLRYNPGQYSEWWAGFHLAAEYLNNPHPEHPALPAHCEQETIDATISKSNHLSATAQMDFTVEGGTPRLLPFNLLGVLRISAVTDADGKPVGFIQEDRNLDNDPWLILPQSAAPGHTYTVKITYDEASTRDSRVIDQLGSGLYYVPERASWYPSFGAFDDRTNFKLHFLSPKNDKFVATGKRVDSKKEKDGWVSDYVSQIPFSVVGFNYGDFVDKSVSDKTLTVTAYAGREIPDQLKGLESALDIAQMRQGPSGGDIDGEYGILRGGFNTAAGAQYAAAKSYQAFRLYEAYFGPLPFETVAVTEQPVGNYGQSFPTLIFLPYLSLLDKTTLNSLRLESRAETREFFDVVAVHEISHQWWGHMVGWKTYHDQWLSEGFADFSAALYLEMYEPKKLKDFWDLDRTYLLNKDASGHRPVDVGPIWLNYQTDSYLEPKESYQLRYAKGSYVLEMLRAIMQDPRSKNPDANFIAMMRDFVQTYAGKNASTEDFERVAEKHYGRPLAWFFNEWVYGTEVPAYNFQYQLSDAPQGKTLLRMTLTQSGVSNSFGMDVPLYIYLQGQPRFIGFIAIQGSRTLSFNARLPVHPEKVAIDVNHSLLANEHQ